MKKQYVSWIQSFLELTFRPQLPVLPTASSPQCKENEHRLEEQSDETQIVGIETECVNMVHILVDVAREDSYIEQCQQCTSDCPPFANKEDDTKAKGYFYHAGCKYDKVSK